MFERRMSTYPRVTQKCEHCLRALAVTSPSNSALSTSMCHRQFCLALKTQILEMDAATAIRVEALAHACRC